jgi:hypothetical protein
LSPVNDEEPKTHTVPTAVGQDPEPVIVTILLSAKFHFLLTEETGTLFGNVDQKLLTCSSI